MAALVLLAGALAPVAASAADSAVIFMYHRFGESKYPATNVTTEQFEAHLNELATGGYTVKPIPEILAAIRDRTPLPDRTVGISIDDAYLSAYREAWPRLRRANLPFTLFISTNPIDRKLRGFMSWNQLRELADGGVTIGNQTASHLHMPVASEARNRDELRKSNDRIKQELGTAPSLIAYPYGEYSLTVGKIAREAGFAFGFGQHSGVLHRNTDPYYLPRFSLNETYGGLRRFRLAANALPIPVTDLTPRDPFLGAKNNPPPFGFTVIELPERQLSQIACYAPVEGKVKIERLGSRRFEVRMQEKFPPGRTRVNCTLPEKGNRWRWLGMQFYVPGK